MSVETAIRNIIYYILNTLGRTFVRHIRMHLALMLALISYQVEIYAKCILIKCNYDCSIIHIGHWHRILRKKVNRHTHFHYMSSILTGYSTCISYHLPVIYWEWKWANQSSQHTSNIYRNFTISKNGWRKSTIRCSDDFDRYRKIVGCKIFWEWVCVFVRVGMLSFMKYFMRCHWFSNTLTDLSFYLFVSIDFYSKKKYFFE